MKRGYSGYRVRSSPCWPWQEMVRILMLVALAIGSPGTPLDAIADTPLPAPSPSTQCSPNGRVCIEMKLDSGGGIYRKGLGGERIDLWAMPGLHRAVFVSDDGRHLVKCYSGLNLVPLDYEPEMSLVEVWRQGTLIHRLSLRAVVGNLSAMPRTVSHYAWGSCLRFESETRFVIALQGHAANGDLIWKKMVLDVVSGQLRRTNQLIPQ